MRAHAEILFHSKQDEKQNARRIAISRSDQKGTISRRKSVLVGEAHLLPGIYQTRASHPQLFPAFMQPGLTLCPGLGWPQRANIERRGKEEHRESGHVRAGHPLFVTQVTAVILKAEQSILYFPCCPSRAKRCEKSAVKCCSVATHAWPNPFS